MQFKSKGFIMNLRSSPNPEQYSKLLDVLLAFSTPAVNLKTSTTSCTSISKNKEHFLFIVFSMHTSFDKPLFKEFNNSIIVREWNHIMQYIDTLYHGS